MTTWQAAASSAAARSLGTKGQGVKLVQIFVQLCPLADDRYPYRSSFINGRYKNIPPEVFEANSKRYYLYLLSMKGKQHMWGELEGEKSKWALRKLAEMLGMRQPRFQGTQIALTTQTRGPQRAAVANTPPWWNNEAANISLTVLDGRKMRRKDSNERATAHATRSRIHKAKGQSHNAARSHLLWIVAIGCRRGTATPLRRANALQNGLWCHFFIHRSWPIKAWLCPVFIDILMRAEV